MTKKKGSTEGLSFKLPLAMKTGIYEIGFKKAIRLLRGKKTKCIVMSSNFPSVKRNLLEYYAALADDVPITVFGGSNNELAKICDHHYRIGVISIVDDGEADMLDIKA
jgi:large subunit ribosomal protein L30e